MTYFENDNKSHLLPFCSNSSGPADVHDCHTRDELKKGNKVTISLANTNGEFVKDQVKVVGAPLRADGTRSQYPLVEVTGYDGKGDSKVCTDRPTREDLWKVTGTIKSSNSAVIDFSPKGGPSNLLATYEDGGIVFPDGNKWTKVARGTDSRRPADMSTLKSD